jgi:hypothetical protein
MPKTQRALETTIALRLIQRRNPIHHMLSLALQVLPASFPSFQPLLDQAGRAARDFLCLVSRRTFLTPPERFCTSFVLRVNASQHFAVHLHEELHVRILGLNDQVVPDRDVCGAIGGDFVLELMSRYVSQICCQTTVDFGDAYEELVILLDFQCGHGTSLTSLRIFDSLDSFTLEQVILEDQILGFVVCAQFPTKGKFDSLVPSEVLSL